MEKISIVVPAYNEEKRIGKTAREYLNYFKNLKKEKILDFEIIFVLNACTDDTLGVVKKFKSPEVKILNFERGGKGFAIVEGFKDYCYRSAGSSYFTVCVTIDLGFSLKARYAWFLTLSTSSLLA